MKRKPYPPDGGLKKQVRPLSKTFSAWDVVLEHFGLKKNNGPLV